MGPVGFEPTRSIAGTADFKSAASASSATGPNVDSEQSRAILEAVSAGDWKRLGGLLGAFDPVLARIISMWNEVPSNVRDAIRILLKQ